MKVKIGKRIYNCYDDGPIMLILTPEEKEQIANMTPEATKFVQYDPRFWDVKHIAKWMGDTDGRKVTSIECRRDGSGCTVSTTTETES